MACSAWYRSIAARALNSIRSRPRRSSSPARRTTSSAAGLRPTSQTDGAACPRQALLALDQHLQGRVLDVGHPAHVERQHARLVLRDQRADLLGHVGRVDEVQSPLRPHDEQALERLVVGVLGRERAQHVGTALAADDRHARVRRLARKSPMSESTTATTMPLSVPNTSTPRAAATAQRNSIVRTRRIALNSAGCTRGIE